MTTLSKDITININDLTMPYTLALEKGIAQIKRATHWDEDSCTLRYLPRVPWTTDSKLPLRKEGRFLVTATEHHKQRIIDELTEVQLRRQMRSLAPYNYEIKAELLTLVTNSPTFGTNPNTWANTPAVNNWCFIEDTNWYGYAGGHIHYGSQGDRD